MDFFDGWTKEFLDGPGMFQETSDRNSDVSNIREDVRNIPEKVSNMAWRLPANGGCLFGVLLVDEFSASEGSGTEIAYLDLRASALTSWIRHGFANLS